MCQIIAPIIAVFNQGVKRHCSPAYHSRNWRSFFIVGLSVVLCSGLLSYCGLSPLPTAAFAVDTPESVENPRQIPPELVTIIEPPRNDSPDAARAWQSPSETSLSEISQPETSANAYAASEDPSESEIEYGPRPPEAGDIKVYTPTYIPAVDGYSPPLGKYRYTVDWEGIPAAFCEVTIAKNISQLFATAQVRTNSFIDIFYKLRYQINGVLSALTYSPQSFVTIHRENSKVRDLNIIFHSNPFSGHADIESTRTTASGGTKHQRFTTDNLTLDPITSVFLARSLPWQVGDSRQFDTFNGKSRYLITLTATSKKKIRLNDILYDTIVIEPRVINLINKKQTAKLRKAYIYVTDDDKRDVIKITSKVLFGSINTTLDSFVADASQSVGPSSAALPTKSDKPA